MAESVLIIEEDVGILAVAKFSLEIDGEWQVAVASGKTGIVKAISLSPDVILLDSNIKTKETKILQQLQHHQPTAEIPVILFSTNRQRSKAIERENHNVVGIITKPFDCLNLSSEIQHILTNVPY